MDLTEGSETSAKLNLTPGKYPKENIQVSEHGENLKSRILFISVIKTNQFFNVNGTNRCLFLNKKKTHKYSVGRAYSC
jgi:hypothetical protein